MTTTDTKPRPRTVQAAPPDPDSEAELQHFSRKQTAKLLGISGNYLYQLIINGEIDCTLIAGSYKFSPEHIRAYRAKGEEQARAKAKAVLHRSAACKPRTSAQITVPLPGHAED